MTFRMTWTTGLGGITAVIRACGVALGLLAMTSQTVLAAGACLRGVNLAGAEFGEENGVYGTAYIYPSDETIAYFAAKGFNSVRLPFSWSRLQTSLNAPFDPAELERLNDAVQRLRAAGLTVVLDPHNYARYRGELIGSPAVPYEAFAQFWTELAKVFANQDGVVFGLMNEPHTMPTEQWLGGANAAIAAIRATGARNLILVPGNSWTGAHSWMGETYGGANGIVMLGSTTLSITTLSRCTSISTMISLARKTIAAGPKMPSPRSRPTPNGCGRTASVVISANSACRRTRSAFRRSSVWSIRSSRGGMSGSVGPIGLPEIGGPKRKR